MFHHQWFIGYYSLSQKQLQETKSKGQKLTFTGFGILKIDPEGDEEMLFSVVQSIRVLGKIICSKAVREHYGL